MSYRNGSKTERQEGWHGASQKRSHLHDEPTNSDEDWTTPIAKSKKPRKTGPHTRGQPSESTTASSSSKGSESSKYGENEDSPQSTTSSENRREAKIRRKTEELARVRCPMSRAKEKYFEGRQIINGKPWRSIIEEKQVSLHGLNQHHEILDQLRFQKWDFLTRESGRYYSHWLVSSSPHMGQH
ncbi:hypothetical protein HAX54_010161 [Datura stramonium]|uniref:Uncharacterized protein n=1 Tax=Datura stramonium TaxID=4076 RepID=A0ABS8TGU3_DATST|nr:hypothetical protein [Datura stramonium]